eukprot:Pgem_evm1s15849
MSLTEMTDVTELIKDISLFPISSVTVYQDRAEVSRLISIPKDDISSVDPTYELKLTNMVYCIDPESIRVRADQICEIAEVNSSIKHQAIDDTIKGGATQVAFGALKAARSLLDEKKNDLERIKQRDEFVQG